MKEESDIGAQEITLCLRLFAVIIALVAILSWFGLVVFFSHRANLS